MVISSLAQGRSSLAVGNIVGAAISNILGAFSLGLLFRQKGVPAVFDRSSRIYSVLLLVVTTIVTPITYFPQKDTWLAFGASLITAFAIYIISIGWAISRGSLSAPEDSDDDTSDESDAESIGRGQHESRETDALIRQTDSPSPLPSEPRPRRRSLQFHVMYLIFGFLAICLAGYVLSEAATNIIDATSTSEVLFGVIILAIATTLPEKFVAVLSGHRGHIGILTANTAGSNIFLLSLCMGIIMVDTSGEFNRGSVNILELAVLWSSTLTFTVTVWVGGRFHRWIGGVMLAGYVIFIVLEFTVIHHAK